MFRLGAWEASTDLPLLSCRRTLSSRKICSGRSFWFAPPIARSHDAEPIHSPQLSPCHSGMKAKSESRKRILVQRQFLKISAGRFVSVTLQ